MSHHRQPASSAAPSFSKELDELYMLWMQHDHSLVAQTLSNITDVMRTAALAAALSGKMDADNRRKFVHILRVWAFEQD